MGGVRFGGSFDGNPAIPASNTGLNSYAQARLDNTVSRAIAKHANSLSVDGIYFNVWTRTLGGIPCTCCGRLDGGTLPESIAITSPDVNANTRQPIQSTNPLIKPLNENSKFSVMRFATNDLDQVLSADTQSRVGPPDKALDFNTPLQNDIDTLNRNLLLEQLSQPVSDDDLARLVSMASTGATFGGDKTPCGICFSTGHVNGYTLNGGMRVILDASNTNPFELHNGALLDTSCHPFKFQLNNKGYVVWTADLTPYALQWLNFAVNNNLEPAQNVEFQLYFENQWQEITLGLLLQLAQTNTARMKLRVKASCNCGLSDLVEFTHAEIAYMLTPPMLGQSPQLAYAINFDVVEPLINTQFELLASIPSLPRETILQDSRTNLLWKVTEVTPKITASGQIFGYDVDVRKIASSEMFYRLLLPLNLPTAPQNQIGNGVRPTKNTYPTKINSLNVITPPTAVQQNVPFTLTGTIAYMGSNPPDNTNLQIGISQSATQRPTEYAIFLSTANNWTITLSTELVGNVFVWVQLANNPQIYIITPLAVY